MLEINLKDTTAIDRFFFGPESDQDLIQLTIYRAVKSAIELDQDQAVVATIGLDSGEQMELVCKRSEYVDKLTNCLTYFEQIEAYETCADILKLLTIRQ